MSRWGKRARETGLFAFVLTILIVFLLSGTNVWARESWYKAGVGQEATRSRAIFVTDPYMYKLRRIQRRVWRQPSPAMRQILRAKNDGYIDFRTARILIARQKHLYGR